MHRACVFRHLGHDVLQVGRIAQLRPGRPDRLQRRKCRCVGRANRFNRAAWRTAGIATRSRSVAVACRRVALGHTARRQPEDEGREGTRGRRGWARRGSVGRPRNCPCGCRPRGPVRLDQRPQPCVQAMARLALQACSTGGEGFDAVTGHAVPSPGTALAPGVQQGVGVRGTIGHGRRWRPGLAGAWARFRRGGYARGPLHPRWNRPAVARRRQQRRSNRPGGPRRSGRG